MITEKFMNIGMLTLLLGTTTLQAECINGACFATPIPNPKNLNKSEEGFKKEITSLRPRYLNIKKELEIDIDEILKNKIDKSFEVVLDGKTISKFPDEVYRMKDETLIVTIPTEKIEDKFLGTGSELYCDNDKKPMYTNISDIYECV